MSNNSVHSSERKKIVLSNMKIVSRSSRYTWLSLPKGTLIERLQRVVNASATEGARKYQHTSLHAPFESIRNVSPRSTNKQKRMIADDNLDSDDRDFQEVCSSNN